MEGEGGGSLAARKIPGPICKYVTVIVGQLFRPIYCKGTTSGQNLARAVLVLQNNRSAGALAITEETRVVHKWYFSSEVTSRLLSKYLETSLNPQRIDRGEKRPYCCARDARHAMSFGLFARFSTKSACRVGNG